MAFFKKHLPRIKDGAYVIKIHDKMSKGTQFLGFIVYRQKSGCILWFYWNSVYSMRSKSDVNHLLRIYFKYKIMNWSYVDFVVSPS